MIAASIETSGTTRPANPRERTKGTGIKKSADKPIATASPESITVRPAVAIVRATASSTGTVLSTSSSLKRCTINSE